MPETSRLESLLRQDRRIVLGGLVLVTLVSWAWILSGAGMDMDMGSGMGMSGAAMAMAPADWTAGYALLMLAMWWVMMVAMMLPSAAPMILLFAMVSRKQREKGRTVAETAFFAAGYLLVWGGFSIAAVILQYLLSRVGLLSPMMETTSAVLGALLLIGAGIYQLTPLKQACLRHCRSPLHFISHHWRGGRGGAVRMGLEHGAFCLGCCWVLMALLFYGGVMNLYWIAGLAIFVLLEKTLPAGPRFGWIGGALLVAWGLAVLSLSWAG